MKNKSTKINEKDLHYALKIYLSDPSKIYNLTDGRNFQILSMGRINVYEGPDFLDIALLIGGKVVIGNAEFHFNSSDWNNHQHQKDERYNSVILHIVCNDDTKIEANFGTLVIDKNILFELREKYKQKNEAIVDVLSTEELQNYALIRLLRFTSNAQKIVNTNNLQDSIKILTQMFFSRYLEKRNRHFYDIQKVDKIIKSIASSGMMNFVNKILTNEEFSIADEMVKLMKRRIADEGTAMRREIILNVVLPLALTQADEAKRINLFVWYWSTRSAHQYGILKRRFPNIPQNFIWQQQGMLEYLREIEHRNLNISEAINSYGIGGVLSFLKWGNISE